MRNPGHYEYIISERSYHQPTVWYVTTSPMTLKRAKARLAELRDSYGSVGRWFRIERRYIEDWQPI